MPTVLETVNKENPCVKREELLSAVKARDGRFGSKLGQIGPQIGQIRDISDQISVHLTNYLSNLGSNLAHFGAKPTFPA